MYKVFQRRVLFNRFGGSFTKVDEWNTHFDSIDTLTPTATGEGGYA